MLFEIVVYLRVHLAASSLLTRVFIQRWSKVGSNVSRQAVRLKKCSENRFTNLHASEWQLRRPRLLRENPFKHSPSEKRFVVWNCQVSIALERRRHGELSPPPTLSVEYTFACMVTFKHKRVVFGGKSSETLQMGVILYFSPCEVITNSTGSRLAFRRLLCCDQSCS